MLFSASSYGNSNVPDGRRLVNRTHRRRRSTPVHAFESTIMSICAVASNCELLSPPIPEISDDTEL